MKDHLDVRRPDRREGTDANTDVQFGDIPDPFAGTPAGTPQPVDRSRMAPAPTRSRVRRTRAVAAAGALLYVAAWPLFVERRPDLAALPLSQVALGLAIPLVAAALALRAAGLRPGIRPDAFGVVVGLLALSPCWFALATLASSPEAHDDRFVPHAISCMLVTAALAAAPLALVLHAYRRAFAALSTWRATALGVGCGGLAAATMVFVCPISTGAHVTVGHGAILLVAGGAAGLLGRRLCRS
jgi:hypothetical protein